MFFKTIILIFLLLYLAGCTKSQTDTTEPKQQQPANIKPRLQEHTTGATKPQIISEEDLKPSVQYLKSIASSKENPLLAAPPTETKAIQTPAAKPIKIGTGFLIDKTAEDWQNSVEGAEIKVDVKL